MIDMNCDKDSNAADPIIKPAPRGFVSYKTGSSKFVLLITTLFVCFIGSCAYIVWQAGERYKINNTLQTYHETLEKSLALKQEIIELQRSRNH